MINDDIVGAILKFLPIPEIPKNTPVFSLCSTWKKYVEWEHNGAASIAYCRHNREYWAKYDEDPYDDPPCSYLDGWRVEVINHKTGQLIYYRSGQVAVERIDYDNNIVRGNCRGSIGEEFSIMVGASQPGFPDMTSTAIWDDFEWKFRIILIFKGVEQVLLDAVSTTHYGFNGLDVDLVEIMGFDIKESINHDIYRATVLPSLTMRELPGQDDLPEEKRLWHFTDVDINFNVETGDSAPTLEDFFMSWCIDNMPTTLFRPLEDRTALSASFEALKGVNIIAKGSLGYTLTQGRHHILQYDEEYEGYALFTIQDRDHALDDGELWIAFRSFDDDDASDVKIGRFVAKVFRFYGLEVTWNGSSETRICVRLDASSLQELQDEYDREQAMYVMEEVSDDDDM